MQVKSKIDYSGRTSDILLLRTVKSPGGDQIVSVNAAEEQPHIVSGIEKMVQRYMVFLLSQAGTCALEPDKGTDLLGDVTSGKIYNIETLRSSVARAKSYADKAMLESIEDGDREDESFKSSEIVDLSIDSPRMSVVISIKLTSAAGESYTYITPVPVGM